MSAMKYKNRLRELREHRSISQSKVANDIGISTNTYQRYEYGERDIPGDVLVKLSRYFLVSCDYILQLSDYSNMNRSYFSDKDLSIAKQELLLDLPVYSRYLRNGSKLHLYNFPCFFDIQAKCSSPCWVKVETGSLNRTIPEGALALVDRGVKTPEDKYPMLICVGKKPASIYYVKCLMNGYELIPKSHDPTYLSQIYDYNKEDTEEITIIGQVVYAAFPFDWEF